MAGLYEKYKKETVPALVKQFGWRNENQAPRLEKATVNCGFGRMVSGKTKDEQKKIQEAVARDLTQICGQRAVICAARKSIAGFKIAKDRALAPRSLCAAAGCYDFWKERLPSPCPVPAIFREFFQECGSGRQFDFRNQRAHRFPEVSPEKINFIFSFEVTVTTRRATGKKRWRCLSHWGFHQERLIAGIG